MQTDPYLGNFNDVIFKSCLVKINTHKDGKQCIMNTRINYYNTYHPEGFEQKFLHCMVLITQLLHSLKCCMYNMDEGFQSQYADQETYQQI